jgi:soluble cytochrome b562
MQVIAPKAGAACVARAALAQYGGKMSLSAISGSSQLASLQTNYQQLRNEFTQLGKDLSSGNLTQAQTDFVTLSQAASSQFGSNSTVSQTLNTIGQDLQSGNLSAAQQAFAALSNGTTAPNAVSTHAHGHHGHHGHSQVQQSLDQLGQALQSGSLTAAQQAFSALQQTWQSISTTTASTATTAISGISMIA